MLYNCDNKNFDYSGRIDLNDPNVSEFYYASSSVSFKFKGRGVSVLLKNKIYWGEPKLGVILDGENISKPLLEENNDKIVKIDVTGVLEDGIHEIMIFKNNATHNIFSIHGIEIDGEILPLEKAPENQLKIEVFGDSVCAGEVMDAHDYVAKVDPEDANGRFDNGYESFVMQTARNLGARIHNNSQGGVALLNDTGYFNVGLENIYNKMKYFYEDKITEWDFARFTPDIVIIEVAQNDEHNLLTGERSIFLTDLEHKEKWKTAYKKLVRELYKLYNTPKFVLTTTVLMHDPRWDETLEEIKNELCSEGIKVYRNVFSRNGAATPGHPRYVEHKEMADELTLFIKDVVLVD